MSENGRDISKIPLVLSGKNGLKPSNMGFYFQRPYRGSKLVKLIEVVKLIKATQKTSLLLVVSIVCGFHPNWLPENGCNAVGGS